MQDVLPTLTTMMIIMAFTFIPAVVWIFVVPLWIRDIAKGVKSTSLQVQILREEIEKELAEERAFRREHQ